ncbi:restriction endonuclease subunit S [Pseudomonas aeruginosa]|uniref:Type I restriction modification DNA specificity domain-containing protein n=4 Tax=Pseudomonas TaxID=286 RepID=A0A6J4ECX0_9PSED|nr:MULTISPECIES: restriction endonuclease subunit S [Pseudomonas]EIU5015083.1 restriction endonuclease subunit S [Pseudomonas aeruginosa]EIZ7652081.1 restriction endonuclease subunit S [Pseudomonas aeruginosa]EKM7584468.1 restriction endonuclease subunit S [Pseudomonas aeruginosa]EKQ6344932.1 restriction endonuclease subunit S [Pseudomonas aeruginosa]EKW9685287.1 restriction endonuclease subunit S [Pseudomonas aeruginosa]
MSWPLVQIGRCVEKVRTWNPTGGPECIFQYVDLSSVDKSKKIIDLDDVAEISSADAPSRARQLVVTGDVLVATVRPNLNGVAVVPAELNGATASTGYCVLRADEKNLHGRYLFYWVQTDSFVEEMMSKATGANYPAVSDKIIKESQIPLPPLPEQKRIAAILDKADAIRRKRQQAIQLADDFLRAVFLDMFGDPVSNPKGWEVKPLGSLVVNKDGKRIPIKASDRADMAGEYPYYGASGVIDYVNDFIFEGRHLLIGEDGANLLARSTPIAFIADGRYWVNNHAHVLGEKNSLSLDYLAFSINMRGLESFVSGSAQPKLNQENLNKIPIQVPPLILVDKFSAILNGRQEYMEKMIISEPEVLFSSLSQKAFSGQLFARESPCV